MFTFQEIVATLDLSPHPEGGFYKEFYRSEGLIDASSLSEDYSGSRNYATSIYFLLTSDSFSAFHKIHQDEIWHFYLGSPLTLHMISKTGDYSKQIIGNQIDQDQKLQFVVKGGDWFAAEVTQADSYALVGCTVSPGFDFDDFEMPARKQLIKLFPEHEAIVTRLTHN